MKIRIFYLTMGLSVMIASSAFAHPPSDIKITFDPVTQIFRAVIYHNTSNPKTHYIKKVGMGLNGKAILSQEISREDNATTQTVSYRIPDANPDDMISVEAYCSISGSLTKKIQVAGNDNP